MLGCLLVMGYGKESRVKEKEASASVFLSVSSCYAYGHSYGPLQT